MSKNRLALGLAAFAVSMILLPTLVAAEPFTLPAKDVYLGSWDITNHYDYFGVSIGAAKWQGDAYYGINDYIFYRVLIGPDGKESVIDEYYFDGHSATGRQTLQDGVAWHFWSQQTIPSKTIDISEPGNYRVELRQIIVPTPTAARFPNLKHDSVVDIWQGMGVTDSSNFWFQRGGFCSLTSPAEYAKTGVLMGYNAIQTWYYGKGFDGPSCTGWKPTDLGCTYQYNDAGPSGSSYNCWLENKTDTNVKLSDLSQLYEYYEITVAGAPVPADIGQSPNVISADSPFSDNKGVAQSDNNGQTAGMAMAGVLAVGAIGAGAYLYKSYTASSGSSFKAYGTALSAGNASAWDAEQKNIENLKQRYAEWYAKDQARIKGDKQSAALAAASAAQSDKANQFQADLAKIQNSKNYAEMGSQYALLASKYSDILTDDGKKQLMNASNAAWSANATSIATATFSPPVLAKLPEPVQPQPVKKSDFLGDTWNGFTGAMQGLAKTVYFGAKEQYAQYSDIVSTALKGDILGANEKLMKKTLNDAAFVGQTVIDHWQEIAMGIVVTAVIVGAIVTAPVWMPVAAAAIGVSTATIAAAGTIVGAAAAAGTVYYIATTYGPELNNVNKSCPMENGASDDCVDARKTVVQQGIVDGTIVVASVGIGNGASGWSKAVAEGKIVDHPNVRKGMETILDSRGVKVVKNTEYLSQNRARGIYDINNKKLTYGDQTRFGDLMHEVRHSTDHANAGYPTTTTMTKSELDIYKTKTEINAYSQDLENANKYGYSNGEITWLTNKVNSLKSDLIKFEGAMK